MTAGYQTVSPLVRWGFYVFVFSIPLEYPDRTIPVEVHTLTGAIFLVIALSQAKVCFRQPPVAFWLFAVYIYIWTTRGLLTGVKYPSEFILMFLIYLEGLLLFWTAYNLMLNAIIARNVLLLFVLSCSLMAALLRFGYLEAGSDSAYAGRMTGMGQDPNIVGGNLALGIVALIGLVYGTEKRVLRFRMAYLCLIPLMGICLVYTGSRGALIALAVGIIGFALKRGDLREKVRNVAGIIAVLLFFIWASYHTGTIWNRYQKTIEDGNMAAREEIYPEAWKMFIEKPLAGWGPINNRYKLATRTAEEGRENQSRDAHNLWLEVLTATGLLGALPFLIGLIACLRAAWKARQGTYGAIPLVLLLTLLIINLNVNWIQSKQDWLFFAYALASGAALANVPIRHRLINTRLRNATPLSYFGGVVKKGPFQTNQGRAFNSRKLRLG